ncbi:amidohydrolase family protein [Streptosporangium sp. NPDC051022]|uniref:metal-dependent hydrolase family protein n=1 Tax=Streptosporangium sp. NPDC051022 TaxID=3155752 RepID=UPI00343159EB
MWLTNCNVVDVESGTVLRGRSVEMERGIITEIASAGPPPGAAVHDLGGRYLMPGFISCHTHLSVVYPFSATDEAENPAITAYRSAVRAQDALRSGVTTMRCVHEQNRADLMLREAAAHGWIDAPRIFGAGRAISRPNGHGKGADCAYATGAAEFGAAAREELRAGADHLKIFITGGLAHEGEDFGEPEMTDEEIRATVEAAHEHDSYVAAHAGAWQAIRQALAQGVRSFEHAYDLDEETARRMLEAGAFLTPTLCVTRSESWMRAKGFEEFSIRNALDAADRHLASIRTAVRTGVPIVAGTDYPPGDDVDGVSAHVHEMLLLATAGLSNLDVLRSASLTAARLVGAETFLGQVAPGYAADVVALRDNPLEDLEALRDVSFVGSGGRIIRDDDLGETRTAG